MARPKHRRCDTCREVTARYSHTQNAGAFQVVFWNPDPVNGEVLRRNGTQVFCTAHAPEEER